MTRAERLQWVEAKNTTYLATVILQSLRHRQWSVLNDEKTTVFAFLIAIVRTSAKTLNYATYEFITHYATVRNKAENTIVYLFIATTVRMAATTPNSARYKSHIDVVCDDSFDCHITVRISPSRCHGQNHCLVLDVATQNMTTSHSRDNCRTLPINAQNTRYFLDRIAYLYFERLSS